MVAMRDGVKLFTIVLHAERHGDHLPVFAAPTP
jgi:hypothetical protein